MKKRSAILAVLLLVGLALHAVTHTYTAQSVLAEGNWVKIRVAESGIHCLTYEQLQKAGLDPANVRIYGYGGAKLPQDFNIKRLADDLPSVPFVMHKGADGVFGRGDYILFYAQGSIDWQFTNGRFAHTRNPYSDYGFYFLSDNAGVQRMLDTPDAALTGSELRTVDTYTARLLHEQDLLNLTDVESGVDGGGQEFFGERFSNTSTSRTFTLNTRNQVADSAAYLLLVVASAAEKVSSFSVTMNGTSGNVTLPLIQNSDHYTKGTIDTIQGLFPVTANGSQRVTLTYRPGIAGATGFLNYIELNAICSLRMEGSSLTFRTPLGYKKSGLLRYRLTGASAQTQVWDITDRADIRRMPTSFNNGVLEFLGSNNTAVHEYIALNPDDADGWPAPDIIGQVPNQNLHALHSIDYVIITPELFLDEAYDLARAHEQVDQMTWAVVTDQQVYNEFSSGTPDATAYRWLMKMLWDRGTGDRTPPEHLLLFGDGTFDNRKLLPNSGNNILLTYQTYNSSITTNAFATDDYFAFMNNNEGEIEMVGRMAFGVGRLPVNDKDEARLITDKLLRYIHNVETGKWKNHLGFLADDGDNGLHTRVAEGGAERVRIKNPDFIIDKIYLDAYTQEISASGESYPVAKNRLDNLLNNGMLYLNYSGHGAYNTITNEGMLDIKDIRNMTNKHLGFWMFATCSFAHFDSGKRSSAEEAILNPNGGAIGVMSAGRTVYATQNELLNRFFCDTLFGHKDTYHYDMTVGQATRIAKNLSGTLNNKLPYVLLGDPALRLSYPTKYHVQTSVLPDTIHALSTHRIEGFISDSDGALADWFNGTIDISILDKLQLLTTQDNDEKDPSKRQTLTYNDYPNALFAGSATVTDGRFAFTFMAPKDIRYNYGNGRIVYYAHDTITNAEAVGHEENFIVGGSSPLTLVDTVGPDIRLYLNSPAFPNGGDTHENPHFYAELYDENGINTVGSGIGHDLLLVIDKDAKQTIVLNDYFLSESGSYQRGRVSYKMSEQAEGQHSLTFRAWDLNNNSSTATLDYNVIRGLDPTIFSVTTYPNPIENTGLMHIQINYDRPDELMQTEMYIYHPSGKLVWSSSLNNADALRWNLAESNVSPGIYLYRVRMQTATGQHASKTGKIIVLQ